jgi:hypothetical protein
LAVLRLIARLLSRVRVNRVELFDDRRVSVIIKRRRWYGSIVIWLGNRFLALANSGVEMFVSAREWVAWEQHCVGLLHADLSPVLAGPGPSVRLPAMPGTSLRRLLEQGDLCPNALVAAARELRRAHRTHCSFFGAGWSHGDLHLDNILYDGETASLIDFDTRHVLGIDETRRHADDLKVFLLELIAAPPDQWRDLATAFLSEYGEAHVLNELSGQLAVPRSFAKILWYTRTDCRPDNEIVPRLKILRETIRQMISDVRRKA